MTEAEYAEKRAKGLCFKCDGKFTVGHKCPEKRLQVMMILEDELAEEKEDEKTPEHVHLDAVEVSAQSIVGITAPHTMKLRGMIRGIEVIVLIDSGARHNFLSIHQVEPLQLTVEGTRETGVIMGNGKSEKSYGICRGYSWSFPVCW